MVALAVESPISDNVTDRGFSRLQPRPEEALTKRPYGRPPCEPKSSSFAVFCNFFVSSFSARLAESGSQDVAGAVGACVGRLLVATEDQAPEDHRHVRV